MMDRTGTEVRDVSVLEERVAYLEGKVGEQSGGLEVIRLRIEALDQKLDRRADGVDQKVDRFRTELASRIDSLDQKVDRFRSELALRIDALDQKLDHRIDTVDGRIDALDQKVSRHFLWLVGIQVTVLVSVIAALLAR